MMRTQELTLAAVIVCAILFSGCAVPRVEDIYHEFSEQKQEINTVSLLVDVVVTHETTEEMHKVDVLQNKQLGEELMGAFTYGLEKRGYTVGESFLSSGLFVDQEGKCRVINTLEEKELDTEALPIGTPPFYIDDQFAEDPEATNTLISVYRELRDIKPKKKPEEATTTLQNATRLQDYIHGDVCAILIVGAHKVGMKRSLVQGLLTAVLTGGALSVYQVSGTAIGFHILDPHTGNVLWLDRKFKKGGQVKEKEVRQLANKIIEQIPDKLAVHEEGTPAESDQEKVE